MAKKSQKRRDKSARAQSVERALNQLAANVSGLLKNDEFHVGRFGFEALIVYAGNRSNWILTENSPRLDPDAPYFQILNNYLQMREGNDELRHQTVFESYEDAEEMHEELRAIVDHLAGAVDKKFGGRVALLLYEPVTDLIGPYIATGDRDGFSDLFNEMLLRKSLGEKTEPIQG